MLDQALLRRLALRPGSTQRFLERAESGERFFPVVDTAWEIFHRLTREEVIEYLDNRQARKLNAVLAVLIPELDVKERDGQVYTGEVASDAPNGSVNQSPPTRTNKEVGGSELFYPNRYGEVPLLNDNPATPNEKYFEHVDWVVQQAAERGLQMWLVPTWSRFTSSGILLCWTYGPILFDEVNARSYGEYVGRRYPYLPKILGGDSNPIWSNGAVIKSRNPPLPFGKPVPEEYKLPNSLDLPRIDITSVIDTMAEGIVSAESPHWNDLGQPLITYHNCPHWLPWSPEARASAFFGDRDWLVLDSCQSGHSDCPTMQYDPPFNKWEARSTHVPISRMWDAQPARPVIDLESHYEEAHNGLRPAAGWMWDQHDIRSGAWQSILSGACGIVYGANVIWQMHDPERRKDYPHHVPVCGCPETLSWKTSLELPGPGQLDILRNYFLSLPAATYESRRPAQELLISTSAPDDRKNRDARVNIMRDVKADGKSTWVVAHTGMGYNFVLDLNGPFEPRQPVKMERLDPRNGDRVNLDDMQVGKVTVETPSKGSVKDDWVYIFTQ